MKMTNIRMLGLIFVLTVTLSACGSEQSGSSQGSYKETKTMVVDILKSDEGKKAVEEALSGGGGTSSGGGMGMKMVSAQSSEEIKTAVKDTLTAPEYKKELEKIMKDPKFAGDFAKAISSENKKLHQELIKDPTYQKAVSEIMKSPEMMKMFLDLTKTPDYRKQSMAVMQEAMQNPLFRMEVMDLLKSVVKEELQPTKNKKEGGDSGGSSGGGDEQGSSGG